MDKHTQIFTSPAKYVQGRKAIYDLGALAKGLGSKKTLVLGGKRGLEATREGRGITFNENGIEQVELLFGGLATYAEYERVKTFAVDNECDTIIGSGGGQTLDIARLAADRAGLISIMVPTVASTDAPISSDSAMYDEIHTFLGVEASRKNPDLVLMDLTIIVNAPVRTLVAGMGDTLSSYFECGAQLQSGKNNVRGGQLTETTITIGKKCLDILLEYGLQAKIAAEARVVTPAFEKIVEANTYFSGVGFESGGLAAAHSMMTGMTSLPALKDTLHGEIVGFTSLMEMVLENHPAELVDRVFRFCDKVGIPTTLEQLGLGNTPYEVLYEAVEKSCAPGQLMHNEPFPLSPDSVYAALITADAMGKRLKAGLPIV